MKELFLRHVGQTSQFEKDLEIARGEGCYLYDSKGRRYLDFIAGIAVANVGHCHPRVVQAVQKQAATYAHTMVYGEHIQEPQVRLAAAIAEVAPEGMETTYFLTTGAEANDAALKLAAKLTGRSHFCAFRKAYHGDTVGALACFGDEHFRTPYQPMLFPVRFLPFSNEADLTQITPETAAVILEPVQGEAGIRLPPQGLLHAIRQRCDATGSLLILDEVQTGFGRLGAWFGAGLYGVIPDVITMAKGMGAGMPLAGVLSRKELITRFAAEPAFSHITTFGGHPVSCAAALAGMHVIREEQLLENTIKRGQQLLAGLQKLQENSGCISEVRGTGLMIGVQMQTEHLARKAVSQCRERGLILETTLLDEQTIRFSPPLIVTEAQCTEALEIFAKTVKN